MRVFLCAFLLFLAGAQSGRAAIMHVAGITQIVISGPIEPGDVDQFMSLLHQFPEINTVILYDSPGGSGNVMQRLTAIIQGRKLDTAVSGNCISACAMIFLSGVHRSFANVTPVAETSIGFHGSYEPDGPLAPEPRLQMIKRMVLTETGGRADPALVERWTHFSSRNHLIRFAYPSKDGRPSIFDCDGGQRDPTDYGSCTPITTGNALTMGIITTLDVLPLEP